VPRLAVTIHEQQVDPLRVDATVGLGILDAEDLAQRDLRHHLPIRIAADYDTGEFLEHSRLAFVEQRLNREI
jgi:hypothetical protein